MSRSVKNVCILSILTVLFVCAVPAWASLVEVPLYGPEQFTRDTGSPTTEVREFSVQRPVAQSYVLQVENGSMEGDSTVSSAVVTLNGTVILKQSDFNQNVYYLEKPVSALAANTLEVKLGSIPASFITITIVGNYLPEDVDDDGDGYTENEGDCNDLDAALNPDTVWYEDADGDGYTTGMTLTQCAQPVGYVLNAASGDCDDTDPAVNPAGVEVCDYVDNNCDGQVDEGVTTTYYLDSDGDGYGLASSPVEECTLPAGYSENADDCDDTNAAINPDTVWYEDADGDGYTTGMTLTQCVQPAGYFLTAAPGDCDDGNAAVNPAAAEVCDYIDNDCDALVDEGVIITYYPDGDSDGYGISAGSIEECALPAGYAEMAGDCDDTNGAVNPGAVEACNSIDDDCDTLIDEGFDSDGDGYTTCGGDCDDTSAAINPAATETCNLIDDDCDGQVDEGLTLTFYLDNDGDGYGVSTDTVQACSLPAGYAESSNDCDDGSYDVNPGAAEICDGIDNDCDGTTDPGCLTGIAVDPESFTLTGTASTQQLTVTGYYSDNTSANLTASSTGTTYTSSDTGVATVSTEGLVTAVGTGTAVITADNGGFTAQAAVTVQLLPVGYIPQPEGSFGSFYEDLVPPDVAVESYDERRFAVITGLVEDRFGGAVAGVTVTVHAHPEYGSVFTDQTGRFSIPVNGAATLTVQYEKTGLMTLQRKVEVPWNDIAVAPTVTMLQRDPVTTQVTFTGNPADVTVHRGSETLDSRGTRAATLVFGGDNRAFTYDELGNQVFHSIIDVRATEYDTEQAMPAVLPPTSAFTYCVELEADGLAGLHFEKPVTAWVDNFIGFDVGEAAPVGYYNRDTAQWEAMENGVVVRLLDTDADGVVDALDADGDGLADDLDGDASLTDEVTGLQDSAVYLPGATYWRFEVDHFSPYDVNWPWFLGGVFDPILDVGAYILDQMCKAVGPCNQQRSSFIEERGRVYHEDIPVPGTGMTLHYASDRVEAGKKQAIVVPVTSTTIPELLVRERVRVELAGKVFEAVLDPLPNQKAVFEWDGLDYLGRRVETARRAKVSVGWDSRRMFWSAAGILRSFALPGSEPTGIYQDGEATTWREFEMEINPDPGGGLARGWTLSPRHRINLASTDVLFKGDGTTLEYPTLISDVFVGNPFTRGYGFIGENGPAVDAQTYAPRAIAADKDRNVYFADVDFAPPNIWRPIILKVDNKGIITHFAGKVLGADGGEGAPALDAVFQGVTGLAVGPDGSVYVAEGSQDLGAPGSRVRRIDPDGTISTYTGGPAGPYYGGIHNIDVDPYGNLYIGEYWNHRVWKVDPSGTVSVITGQPGIVGNYSGDGGPATGARLRSATDVAVDRDGNVYIADTGNHRVRKVSTDGIITTVAGNGTEPALAYGEVSPFEGQQATQMPVHPSGLEVDGFGNLYIMSDMWINGTHMRVLKVDPSGIITTVAGGGFGVPDGGPASETRYGDGAYIEVDDVSNVYLSFSKHHVVRIISPATEYGYSAETGEFSFPEESGVGHVISPFGLHERTVDLATGQDLLTFGYDGDGNPTSITDRFGNQTTVQRDAAGTPLSITSPDGVVTTLTVDGNGDLTRVNYPDGTFYAMTYSSDGLLTFETDPAGNTFETRYDGRGKVSDVLDPEGGHWTYDRTVSEDSSSLLQVSSAEGDFNSYADAVSPDGEFTSLITGTDGSESTYRLASDGMSGDKQTSCGVDVDFGYTLDREYQYKVMNSSTTTMPSALSVTTSSSRAYSDSDADGTNDRITDTVTVNGKASTVVNDVLTGTVTATSPTGRQVTSYYDPVTLLTSRTSTPGLLDTDFTYDPRGRLETVSVGTRSTTFAYDVYGYLDYMTTPDGRTFDYTYDVMGRLTGEVRPDGGQVDYSYDENGNVTAIVNPNNITHGFTYTANDQRESYNTPLSGSYTYLYDRDRRLRSVTYPSGQTITNTWATGQLQSTTTPEGLISYGYDCGGKLGSVTRGTESASYTYDGSLLLTDTRAGMVNQTISYGYNTDLQVDNITYAGVTDSFTYDLDGLLTNAGPYTVARNAANGLPESVSDGTVTQGRDFSSYGEVDGVDYTVGAVAAYSWAVSRDNAGRITRKVENIGTDTVTWDYTYDQMGRLETVYKDNNLAEAYSYDGQGNRVEETNVLRGVSRTYTHDDEDKIVWAGLDAYIYNVDGFLTTRTIGGQTDTFDYSSRGELLAVSLSNGDNISYDHDPMGRRISKSVNGVVIEKYLWQDATTLLAVLDASGNVVQRFEYADGRMPVSMVYNGSVYYLTYDQVGSLRVVTDAAGVVVKRIDYDSFGNILNDSNPTFSVLFGFAGGLHDRDTGLVRFGARDYDPATGKWTAKDPIDFGGGDLNLLGYCLGDPVNFIDPEGLQPVDLPCDWNEHSFIKDFVNVSQKYGINIYNFNFGVGVGVTGQIIVTDSGLKVYFGFGAVFGISASATGGYKEGTLSGWTIKGGLTGGKGPGVYLGKGISEGGELTTAGIGVGLGFSGALTVGYTQTLIDFE